MPQVIGYFDSVVSDQGQPIQATISVLIVNTQTYATIYTDAAGSVEKDNPFQTDAYGRFQFYADVSTYDIRVSGTGITTYVIENVPVIGANHDRVMTLCSGTFPDEEADRAKLLVYDVVGAAGKASFYFVPEIGGHLIVAGILLKETTGNPATAFEGMMVINTIDNNLKMWADNGWRTLGTW